MRWLVVNADDLGLSPGVNDGIVRAHAEGIVTSASLMVRAAHADAAAAAARERPSLGLGLHVDLGEWEYRDGDWRSCYEVVDTADAEAVSAEVERQLERFRKLVGRDPGHLDSHQHVHRDEPVRTIMARLAARLGVPLRHDGGARFCGSFYGQGRRGQPLPEAIAPEALVALVHALPEGVTELCCHPATTVGTDTSYASERPVELASLCDERVNAAVAAAGVRLATFAQALQRA